MRDCNQCELCDVTFAQDMDTREQLITLREDQVSMKERELNAKELSCAKRMYRTATAVGGALSMRKRRISNADSAHEGEGEGHVSSVLFCTGY